MSEKNYAKDYSDEQFWNKAKRFAKAAGETVLTLALELYYAAQDPDTPAWAKTVIWGALGYFISPVDAIPDVVPLIGYTDDMSVLAAAVATVAAHVKDPHVSKAKSLLKQWFS